MSRIGDPGLRFLFQSMGDMAELSTSVDSNPNQTESNTPDLTHQLVK